MIVELALLQPDALLVLVYKHACSRENEIALILLIGNLCRWGMDLFRLKRLA